MTGAGIAPDPLTTLLQQQRLSPEKGDEAPLLILLLRQSELPSALRAIALLCFFWGWPVVAAITTFGHVFALELYIHEGGDCLENTGVLLSVDAAMAPCPPVNTSAH